MIFDERLRKFGGSLIVLLRKPPQIKQSGRGHPFRPRCFIRDFQPPQGVPWRRPWTSSEKPVQGNTLVWQSTPLNGAKTLDLSRRYALLFFHLAEIDRRAGILEASVLVS